MYSLPYIEQNALYQKINPRPDVANSVGIAMSDPALQVPLKTMRCPSDDYDANATVSNYIGSLGPQCAPGPNGYDPNTQYCQTAIGWGYMTSPDHGNTPNPSDLRGMFCRYGATVTMSSVTDGLSNTILVGENLPRSSDHLIQAGATKWWGYNYGNSHSSTIVPINARSDGTNCTDPVRSCPQNWNISWGFKSNHSGGANFVFGDGSVRFVTQTIEHRTYQLLGCRNDGLPVVLP